jgi:uncharacterized protein YjiS (DUF1127 family)
MAIFSKLSAYFRFRATVAELSRLTDRQLTDIGLTRFDIEGTARDLSVVA